MFPTQRLSGAQVFADKIGTVVAENGELCVWGNYAPAWTDLRQTYTVRGLWADALWKARKLDHAKYDEYVAQARDGVPGRKRNLAAVLEAEEEAADDAEMAETIKRIRGNHAGGCSPKAFLRFRKALRSALRTRATKGVNHQPAPV